MRKFPGDLTIPKFLELLEQVEEEFILYNTMIVHKSPSGSLWNPICMVKNSVVGTMEGLWFNSTSCGIWLGLSNRAYWKIWCASTGKKPHDIMLRKKILKATGLYDASKK